jgi:1,4-dihydroxy-2-naphthoate octaprenyltransferase
VPAGLLVAAILHGNEWRDISEDVRLGFTTLSAELGKRAAHGTYVGLVLGAYLMLALAVMAAGLGQPCRLGLLDFPGAPNHLSCPWQGSGTPASRVTTVSESLARYAAARSALLTMACQFVS